MANILKAGFLALPGAFYRTKCYCVLNSSCRCVSCVYQINRSLNCNENRTINSGCCNNHKLKVFLNQKELILKEKQTNMGCMCSSSSCCKVGWLLYCRVVGSILCLRVEGSFSKILIPKMLLMYVGSTLKPLWIKTSANVK